MGFALGVVLFALMAHGRYPWMSTEHGVCPLFHCVNMFGLKERLKKQKLNEVFSKALTKLIAGLLEIEPQNRFSLGESGPGSTVVDGQRLSVWDMQWLETVD